MHELVFFFVCGQCTLIIIIILFFYSANSRMADRCAVACTRHIINVLININANYIN